MKNTNILKRIAISVVISLLVSLLCVSLTYGELAPLPMLVMFGIVLLIATVVQLLSFLISKLGNAARAIVSRLVMIVYASAIIGFVIYALIRSAFRFNNINWQVLFLGCLFDPVYWICLAVCAALILVLYGAVIDKGFFGNAVRDLFRSRRGLKGQGDLEVIEANLENSRWMSDRERDKIFSSPAYETLGESKKDGIPIRAIYHEKDNDIKLTFQSPCHSIVIGSTGSGKTTAFINPMIQLLGSSGAGSSMIISDPKGELFSLHSGFLKKRGYDVKVLDLRDTYRSYRWNPLEALWDTYREYAEADKNAFERNDGVAESGLKLARPAESFGEVWYEFMGSAYPDVESLTKAVKVFRAQRFDEMYEDMSDLVSTLIPIENPNDPMWEKGARSITMAVLLAMLEDSEDPALGMTKDRFNLFNLTKMIQNSEDDYLELRRYFSGRDVLSRAVANAKQVLDAADKTRASYMSVLLEKLSIFHDAGICGLTSESDIRIAEIAERPTALFVKIPDEKDTRHGLASIFLTNVYKALIKKASSYEDLSLPRNVYYILDEFGNLPKLEKFDKMITVGRSRKIWFTMVVQSYGQLNNIYGDKVADIIKGNCGMKMFIGSNDLGTCKEFSELCGNMTVVTKGSSSAGKSDVNYSQNLQTRPLIYPSELQKLNNKLSTGNSIVVTFGNYPLKTAFTPSYKVPLYENGAMDTDELEDRLFEEDVIFYDITKRNQIVLGGTANEA